MLEKLVQKLANFIAYLLVIAIIGGVVFLVGGSRLTKSIHTHKAFNGAPKTIYYFHNKAKAYKEEFGVWPKTPLDWDSTLFGCEIDSGYIRYRNNVWGYTFTDLADTFIITATVISNVEVKGKPLKKQYLGEFITVDNFGNKTYSHDELKDKYMRAYLTDAKKVEGN